MKVFTEPEKKDLTGRKISLLFHVLGTLNVKEGNLNGIASSWNSCRTGKGYKDFSRVFRPDPFRPGLCDTHTYLGIKVSG